MLKKFKRQLLHDPAIPLLRMYLKEIETGYQRGVCYPMFIATLLTIAETWKQLKRLSTDA